MLLYEVPSGAIDGVNTIFTVSSAYVSTSTEVFIMGQAKIQADTDGWDETDPTAGIITMKAAPRTDDRLLVAFRT